MRIANLFIQKTRPQRGFVLIEATIAFLLVSIGIVGIMMLSIRGSRASQESYERTEAVNLATFVAAKVRGSGNTFLEWNGVDVNKTSTWPAGLNPATRAALNELKGIASRRLHLASAVVTLSAPGGVGVACAASPCEMVVEVVWTGASETQRQYALYSWVGL